MPVIIPPEQYDVWLDPAEDTGRRLTLLRPFPAGEMETDPVGTLVNNPRNENPTFIESLPAG